MVSHGAPLVICLNAWGVIMKHANRPKSVSEIQLEQLARELETEEGRIRLGKDAYKEALAAEKRKPIHPRPPKC